MRAKKSLGQNFLKSKGALRSMISAGEVKAGDTVLEVGPGKGALTEFLLQAGAQVIAIEKDESLAALLREKFPAEIAAEKLKIIEGDILEFDPGTLLSAQKKNVSQEYKIIANIPYYITGVFLRKFLTASFQPERMVLLLQKEVGKRIVARDEKESILSISVKAYGIPRYIETVEAKYFSPEPNVDSAIIAITDISRTFFKKIDENSFFELVKAGFAHKRKQLGGNLKGFAHNSDILATLGSVSIEPTARAEDLKLEDWKNLAQKLQKTA